MKAIDLLALIPAPCDAPAFDAERAWHDLAHALEPLVARDALTHERLAQASENALRRRLAHAPCNVLHFIGRGNARAAAQYATLTVEDSARRSRSVNVQHLATLLRQHETLQLVVLQSCDEGEDRLAALADALARHGVPAVVSTPRLERDALVAFARAFYGALVAGESGEHAIQYARDALVHVGRPAPGLRLRAQRPDWRLVVDHAVPARAAPTAPREALHAPSAAERAQREAPSAPQRHALEIARKRAAGEFDVFLCHNGADKPAVKTIAQRLIAAGVRPWLDEWELRPGRPWQPLLEQQIANIKSAAVFVGAAGIGPWQEQEINGFLRQFVKRASPVIPVLLPDAPATPQLPIFLEAMTWVDFRLSDPDPLERLIWGITGTRAIEI